MTNAIQKFEPMIVIELKNGRKLLTSAKNRQEIEERWMKRFPVKIENVTVDGYDIRIIEDLPKDHDILIGLTEEQRNKALAEFRQSREALGCEPSRTVKLRKIEKILNA